MAGVIVSVGTKAPFKGGSDISKVVSCCICYRLRLSQIKEIDAGGFQQRDREACMTRRHGIMLAAGGQLLQGVGARRIEQSVECSSEVDPYSIRDLSTRPRIASATTDWPIPSSSATASAASTVKCPMKIATRRKTIRSTSDRWSWLQARAALSVWCRGFAVRRPNFNKSSREPSRAAVSFTPKMAAPSGGELDRKRDAVELATDLRDKWGLFVAE